MSFLDEPKALISVYDKTGIGEFAKGLAALGFDIVSTGSTAQVIRDSGVKVTDVSAITGWPEMLDGRVKTLHPKVHGGILARTDSPEHLKTVARHDIPYFRLVCVDMYPFEKELARRGAKPAEVNEQIDIGGPTMLRAAAKARRIVLSHPSQRQAVLEWLQNGCPDEAAFLDELAARVFYETARYDLNIARYMGGQNVSGAIAAKHSPVKYGENAWQAPAAFYADNRIKPDPLGLDQFEFLDSVVAGAEKFEKGFVGQTDADRLLQTATHIAAGFQRNFGEVPYIAVGVKHGNACGAAVGKSVNEAVKKMLDGDTRAIFGGVVLVSGLVDEKVAKSLMHHSMSGGQDRLLDGILAAGFTQEARTILSRSKLRLVKNPALAKLGEKSLDKTRRLRPVRGGLLEQPNYTFVQDFADKNMEFMGGKLTTQEERDMILGWAVGSTSNSNTITIVKNGMLIGNGVGQQDRIGAGQLALSRTNIELPSLKHKGGKLVMTITLDSAKIAGAVAYSDSFFPFPDGPTFLVDAGIKAIMSSYVTDHHLQLLQPLAARGCKFALMPDAMARGFYNH